MANATAFGLWLKQQRQARKLPRKELAAAIDCSEVEIVKIEGGTRRPSHQLAELLAAYFGGPATEWPAGAAFARADLPAYRLAQLTAGPRPPPWRQLKHCAIVSPSRCPASTKPGTSKASLLAVNSWERRHLRAPGRRGGG